MASGSAKQLHTAGSCFLPGTKRKEREEIERSSDRTALKKEQDIAAWGGQDTNHYPALFPKKDFAFLEVVLKWIITKYRQFNDVVKIGEII